MLLESHVKLSMKEPYINIQQIIYNLKSIHISSGRSEEDIRISNTDVKRTLGFQTGQAPHRSI